MHYRNDVRTVRRDTSPGTDLVDSWEEASAITIDPLDSEDISLHLGSLDQPQGPHHCTLKNHQCDETPNDEFNLQNEAKMTSFCVNWRSDAYLPSSDWEIAVIAIDQDRVCVSTSIYHCHYSILTRGPRACQAFEKMYQDGKNQGYPSSKTNVELSYPEAAAFPLFLDFLYCKTKIELSADVMCGLYGLAIEFDCEMLMTAIQNLARESLTLDQSIHFLRHAREYPDTKKIKKLLMLANSRICAYVVKSPSKAARIAPGLLVQILEMRRHALKTLRGKDPEAFSGDWERKRSLLLSVVVAECCRHSMAATEREAEEGWGDLDKKTFEELTQPQYLPALDPDAAISLLKVDFMLDDCAAGNNHHAIPRVQSNSLESRSMDAIVSGWGELLAGCSDISLIERISFIKPSLLAEIMIKISRQYERCLTSSVNTNAVTYRPRRCDGEDSEPCDLALIDVSSLHTNNLAHIPTTTLDIAKAPLWASSTKENEISTESRPTDDDSSTILHSYSTDRYSVVGGTFP